MTACSTTGVKAKLIQVLGIRPFVRALKLQQSLFSKQPHASMIRPNSTYLTPRRTLARPVARRVDPNPACVGQKPSENCWLALRS